MTPQVFWGLEMLPGSDNVNVSLLVFDFNNQSILSGPVFAKNRYWLCRKYTDPDFGYLNRDFYSAKLHRQPSIPFGVMAGDTAHLAELVLFTIAIRRLIKRL
jgi:hypothetical protein